MTLDLSAYALYDAEVVEELDAPDAAKLHQRALDAAREVNAFLFVRHGG